MATKIPGGLRLPHLQALPAGNRDGEIQYQGNGLWLNDGNTWYPIGAIQYRNANTGVGQAKVFTGTAVSNAQGGWTLDLPAGYFNAVHNVQGTCTRPSATAGSAAWSVTIGISSAQVTGQTFTGAATLLINASPITVVGGVTVQLLVVGI